MLQKTKKLLSFIPPFFNLAISFCLFKHVLKKPVHMRATKKPSCQAQFPATVKKAS